MNQLRTIDIVFGETSKPNEVAFVEVEDENGKGIRVGKWVKREDGYWVLRLQVASDAESEVIVNTQWRPMETAPRDGTVIEMLSVDGNSIFVRWSERQWVSLQAIARNIRIFLEGSAWRTVHPEWAQHVRPLELTPKEK